MGSGSGLDSATWGIAQGGGDALGPAGGHPPGAGVDHAEHRQHHGRLSACGARGQRHAGAVGYRGASPRSTRFATVRRACEAALTRMYPGRNAQPEPAVFDITYGTEAVPSAIFPSVMGEIRLFVAEYAFGVSARAALLRLEDLILYFLRVHTRDDSPRRYRLAYKMSPVLWGSLPSRFRGQII